MKISKNGINLIKRFEGVRLKSYKADPSEKLWTIGYGHYGVADGLTITQAKAEEYLVKDLAKYEKKVNKYLSKYNFNQNQFDALVSFAFNIGSIDQLTANGTRNFAMISMKMLEYNKCGGKELAGLTRRRKAERELFMTPIEPECSTASAKSLYKIAEEVIDGKWGNGDIRKKRLTDAGYDYKAVQTLVNYKLQNR